LNHTGGTETKCSNRLKPDFNRTIEISIPIQGAGAFAFYTTYTPLPDLSETKPQSLPPTKTPTYYIDVAPRLSLGREQLPIPAVSVFSIISKLMGKYPNDWEKHLAGISKRGYNMIHFTPLQQRGASNSPYSIYDQLGFDPECFPNGEKDIAKLVENMEKNYGLLGMTDVVLNHTAHNAELLQEHPDVGYNVETAPWLTSALELDTALLGFGDNLESLGYPTLLNSVDDLLKIMDGIKEHVIAKLKLWEFYVINVERDADAIVDAWMNGQITFPEGGFGGSGIGGLEASK